MRLILAVVIFFAGTLIYGAPQIENILKGEDATKGEFPFVISVQLSNGSGEPFVHICGGSLISQTAVLTAAQCLDNLAEKATIRIEAGKHVLSVKEKTARRRTIDSYLVHPNASTGSDIAILYFKQVLDVSKVNSIAFVPRLANRRMDRLVKTSDTAVVMGWGIVCENPEELTDVLQKLNTTFIKNKRCNRRLEKFSMTVSKTEICSLNRRAGFCLGDAGNPAGFYFNDEFVQVGIASRRPSSVTCRNGRQIYTRISAYAPWIIVNSDIPS